MGIDPFPSPISLFLIGSCWISNSEAHPTYTTYIYVHLRTVARLYDCTTYGWLEDVLPTNLCAVHGCSSTHASVGWNFALESVQGPSGTVAAGPAKTVQEGWRILWKERGQENDISLIYNIIYICIYIYIIYYIYIYMCVCVCSQKVRLDLSFKNGGLSIANGDSNRFVTIEHINMWTSLTKMAACRSGNTHETI